MRSLKLKSVIQRTLCCTAAFLMALSVGVTRVFAQDGAPELTFINRVMTAADFGAAAKDVDMQDPVTGTTKVINIAATARSYASLLPAADPGYDYYEWRVCNNGAENNFRIGGKAQFILKKGWTTVTLTWKQLNDSTKNIYKDSEYSMVYLGSLTGVKVGISTKTGASIRFSDEGGIRFSSVVSVENYNALKSSEHKTVTFGMLTLPGNVSVADLTIENTNALNFEFQDEKKIEENGNYMFNAAIIGIPEVHYNTKISARAYVKITYDNGESVYIYADYNSANHSRSVKSVAVDALSDETKEWSAVQKAILNKFAGVQNV